MPDVLVAAAALAAGYTLGRLRPGHGLVDWNWDRTLYSDRTSVGDVSSSSPHPPLA